MSSNLVLGVRVVRNQYQRIKVDNVDLEGKVCALRETASQKINKAKDELDLIYAGILLEDDSSLSSYGIKQGVTVHVLERKTQPKPKKAKPLPEADILQLIATIEDFCFRSVLQRLARPEVIEKIIAKIPSLAEDPSAIALLQNPDLVTLFVEPAVLRKALEIHPVLNDAIPHIISYVKENATSANQNAAGTSTGYSYSLEALSDDDDMESSDSAREANPLTRNTSFNAITAAQLAAAIANATTQFSSTGAVINPPTQNSAGSVITNEMFGSALQQAFASSPSVNATPPLFPTVSSGGEESYDAIRTRLQPQLQQMREMGLINEALNIRALQATSGDVQAAIELVFNGVID